MQEMRRVHGNFLSVGSTQTPPSPSRPTDLSPTSRPIAPTHGLVPVVDPAVRGPSLRHRRCRASVAIIHTTQLPLLFISGLGFGPRFRASGFALHLGGHLKYPMVRTRVAQLHSTAAIRITQLQVKLLFIANATRSRSTFGGNMVEYHMVRGPKPRPEMIE